MFFANIFLLFLLGTIACCFGSAVLRVLRVETKGFSERFAIALPLGLGGLSFGTLFLGLAAKLSVPWLWGLLAVFAGIGVLGVSPLWCAARSPLVQVSSRGDKAFLWVLGALVLVTLLITQIVASIPPFDNNDVLSYHFSHPKIFLQAGKVFHIPFDWDSTLHFFEAMLFTLTLGIGGVGLASSVQTLFGLSLIAMVFALLKPRCGILSSAIAACVVLFTPLVYHQMSMGYVDLILTTYTFGAFGCLWMGRERNSTRWVVVGGLFLGLAMATKPLAANMALGLSLMIFMECITRRQNLGESGWMVLRLFATALSVCGFFYGRAYFISGGNPVYPYMGSLFPSSSPILTELSYSQHHSLGMGTSILALLLLPWNLTMHPEAFEGYGARLSLLPLALVPGVMFLQWRDRLTRWSLLVLLVVGLTWFFQSQRLRFFLPLLPFLALISGLILNNIKGSSIGIYRLFLMLILMVFCVDIASLVVHARDPIRLLLGQGKSEEYLTRNESTYAVAQRMNAILPKDARVLCVGEVKLFYMQSNMVQEKPFRMFTRYDHSESERGALDRLEAEGFTHVLITEAPNFPQAMRDSSEGPMSVRRLVEENSEVSNHFTMTMETPFKHPQRPEGDRVYRLYGIEFPEKV